MKNTSKLKIYSLVAWKIFMSHTFAIIIYCHDTHTHASLDRKACRYGSYNEIFLLLFNHHPDLCPVNETSLLSLLCWIYHFHVLSLSYFRFGHVRTQVEHHNKRNFIIPENSPLWFDMNGNCCFVVVVVVIIYLPLWPYHVRNWIDKLFDLGICWW